MSQQNIIKILCVEDETAVAEYISSLLDKNKYSVKTIGDGKEALNYLLSTTNPPDIVLLDYNLPSMDGINILKELKGHKKQYAVIFLTADETLDTALMAMKEGALDYLTKSNYLQVELNIKIEKAFQTYQEQLKKDYYEDQLALLSMAVEQSPNHIIITNTKGEIEYVNKQFTNITGYTYEEVKGKNPRMFKTTNYEPGFFENLWKTITSGNVWQGNLINKKKNGEIFYEKATITPITNKSGDIISYLGSKENITELRKAEQAVKASEERLRSIFEMANAGMFFADKNGQIVLVNSALQNLLGYSFNELCNMDFNQFTHLDDLSRENTMLHHLVNHETDQYRIEKRYINKQNQIIWVDLALTIIYDENKRPINYVGVVQDITQGKQYEQNLIDLNITKDKFFSIIAHDLRGQFSIITGFSELLLERKNNFSESEKDTFISHLNVSGKHAFALLEDLLQWSSSQIDKLDFAPQKLNLLTLVEDVLLVVTNQAILKNIEIACIINSTHEIYADKNMMNTVLRNLLSNAVKFTNTGGKVIITDRSEMNLDIITVEDNGVGMTQDIMTSLFRIDKKQSTDGTEKEKGTGLGLILCKEFIEKHGGTIKVTSELDKGSKFIISILKKPLG